MNENNDSLQQGANHRLQYKKKVRLHFARKHLKEPAQLNFS